jgi:hypothetical protein
MSSEKVTQAPADDGSKGKKATTPAAAPEEANLDLLEEDDEFEEFPAESQQTTPTHRGEGRGEEGNGERASTEAVAC